MKICINCTGCGLCEALCPESAITLKKDDLGFYFPDIDKGKCIKCNSCYRNCPQNSTLEMVSGEFAYAIRATDTKVLSTSTSGGAAAIISQYVLCELGGVVYGHCIVENELKCVRIDNVELLNVLSGSKYAQSRIYKEIYERLQFDLNDNRRVLFIGTPCQIAGILKYTNYNKNLITMSFICGGVPSFDYVIEYANSKNISYDKIMFRENIKYGIQLRKGEETVYQEDRYDSLFYMGYDGQYILRDSCYCCKYARPERIGDITVGDFWGLVSESFSDDDLKMGISIVIPTSETGLTIVDKLIESNLFDSECHDIKDAYKENYRLLSPPICPRGHKKFFELYPKHGFVGALKKALGVRLCINRIKQILKRSTLIRNIVNKLRTIINKRFGMR